MIYDTILKVFSDELPNNFILNFNDNFNTDWASILKEVEDKTVHGVMQVDAGETDFVGDQSIVNKNLHITFAIPKDDTEEFQKSVEAIESLLSLNNVYINVENDKICKLIINGITSLRPEVINRVIWGVIDLTFSIQIFSKLLTSEEVEIKINNTKLDVAITNVVYDYSMANESKIIGTTNIPTNFPQAMQKQLIITCIPEATAPIYQSLIESEDAKTIFAISYKNGLITRTFNAYLIGVNETVITGGTFATQIKFLRTKG